MRTTGHSGTGGKESMHHRKSVIISAAVVLLLHSVVTRAQISPPTGEKVFFAGVVGQSPSGGNRVLLRWYPMEGELPFDEFTVYRKPGNASAPNSGYQLITRVGKIRNINTVRSLFEQPGSEQILADVQDVLSEITGETITNENYAQELIEILEGGCESCGFQTVVFAQVNWGVAIVEGMGYVDPVGSGINTYELHAVDSEGNDSAIIGQITIDADSVTELPPPSNATEVLIPGAEGDRTVFLKWTIPPALRAVLPLAFGFNLYRYHGTANTAEEFFALLDTGQLTLVNDRPVVILSPTPEGEDPNEVYFFSDDGRTIGETDLVGERFQPGTQLTYWVTARDLFGQRGRPSDPVQVIVRDQLLPEVPRNPRTKIVRSSGQRRILLQWDRNSDDTTKYNIYRFRNFSHAGLPGPFAPVDGLTEGLVAGVPQSITGTVEWLDLGLDEGVHANKAVFYTVSAVDLWDNESGQSPPVRGVIFDTTPPIPPRVECVERTEVRCFGQATLLGYQFLEVGDHLIAFLIDEPPPEITRFVISRTVDSGSPETVYDGPYAPSPESGQQIIEDSFPPPGSPTWTFEIYTQAGLCGSFSTDRTVGGVFGSRPIRAQISVAFSIQRFITCDDDSVGRRPHHPVVGGSLNPVRVVVTKTDLESVGAILYRAHDCENYEPIDEKRFGIDTELELTDFFNPNSSSIACYAVRTFDENYNLSPFAYLQTQIVFVGHGLGLLPAVQKCAATGDEIVPLIRVDWFGPKAGIAGYAIRFVTDEGDEALDPTMDPPSQPLPPMESRWLLSELFYNEGTSTFSTEVRFLDDDSNTPVTPDVPYRIKVIALDAHLNEIPSANEKIFAWTQQPIPPEILQWPIRGLPHHSPFPSPIGFEFDPDPNDGQLGGVLIPVGIFPPNDRRPIEDRLFVPLPFVIYRQRVDIPDQPWMQISPLFEFIATDPTGLEIQDPYFYHLVVSDNISILYYVDNAGLVERASYRYQIIIYSESGELQHVLGPSQRALVTPP